MLFAVISVMVNALKKRLVLTMENFTKINENIHRLTIPYKDIFTTVYTVETEKGVLLFDAASYNEDIDNYILPMLGTLGIDKQSLKYIFISHNHKDHAGGLSRLKEEFPDAVVVSRCPRLREVYSGKGFFAPRDADTVLDVLKVVTIPGHTADSSAVFDTRTKTLISGDSLQLYGIFGSGEWGANIAYVSDHLAALDKLCKMDIESIYTAHIYHPYGYSYNGKDAVSKAIDACREPLLRIKELILANPDLDDMQIRELYNTSDRVPTVRVGVVAEVRKQLL